MELTNVTATIKNVTLANKSSSASSYLCLQAYNSDILVNGLKLDMSGYGGTNGRFLTLNTDSKLKGENIELIQGTANMNNLFTGDGSTGLLLDVKKVSGDFTTTSVFNVTNQKIEFTGKTVVSATIAHDVGAADTTTHFSIPYKNDRVIVYNVNATTSVASLKDFGLGNFVGQMLMIKNVNGTNNLIITSTGTNKILSGTVSIAPKQAVMFTWDGTSWFKVS